MKKKILALALVLTTLAALLGCTATDPGHVVVASSEAELDGVTIVISAANGGVTDHGELTGLGDDDHPQYHNDARGDARYYTQVALDAGQLDARYYTEAETDAEIAAHAALDTETHGVGTGTISSVSTANKNIYVDKEATGSANGTSWADAFTTIQAAVDSMEDLIIHTYTIEVRDGTKKTGTADQNLLNHLVDDANSQFVAGDVGKRVFNVDDGTWGVVGSFVDAGDLGIVDTAGANLDLFPAGNEDYVIEATPYREIVDLNSDPASYPAHVIKGSVIIEAEYYWYGDCGANANAGEIVDALQDFSNVELGDRVFIVDQNGVNSRAQDGEYGTVDDVSQLGAGIVRTTLTRTPTTKWIYAISKASISGSDDGTDGGTARNYGFNIDGMNNVTGTGFYIDWCDDNYIKVYNGRGVEFYGIIAENSDYGIQAWAFSEVKFYYGYSNNVRGFTANCSRGDVRDSFLVDSARGLYAKDSGVIFSQQTYFDVSTDAVFQERFTTTMLYRCGIDANCPDGIHAAGNSYAYQLQTTNNAVMPENPAGTVEGTYIQ